MSECECVCVCVCMWVGGCCVRKHNMFVDFLASLLPLYSGCKAMFACDVTNSPVCVVLCATACVCICVYMLLQYMMCFGGSRGKCILFTLLLQRM